MFVKLIQIGMVIFHVVDLGFARDSMVLMEPPIKASPELKSMLLENLNKHANNLDELEPLQTAKSRGSTTFSTKTTIELDDQQNLKTTTASSDGDAELPFNLNQLSGLFDDSDLTKTDTNLDRIPFTPLSNFEDTFHPQPSLNTVPPAPVFTPSQLSSFFLPTSSNPQQQSLLLIPPVSSGVLQALPPGLVSPPALPRPSSSPGAGFPPGPQIPQSIPNSFPGLLSPPPNISFPPVPSFPNVTPLQSLSTSPSTSFVSPSLGLSPLPGQVFQSSSSFPSNPQISSISPLSFPSPSSSLLSSQALSYSSSSPSTSVSPFPTSPSSHTTWRITEPQPRVFSQSAFPASIQSSTLLTELPVNPLFLNNSLQSSPLSSLPALIPLPALQVAEEWSRNIRTTTVTPLTIASIFTTPSHITSTLAPLDVKEWRNRFYKTFKRINKKKKQNEKRPWKNNDTQRSDGLPRNASSDGQKAFDVEKSGYDFLKVQQGRPQTSGLQNRLKEYAFAGNRSLESFQPVSLKDMTKENAKNQFQKAKVQPLPYRQFQVNNDVDDIEAPCPAVGCNAKAHNPWIFQNDVILDNTDTCNNDKLRRLAESTIVPTDAEASKRLIQKRFEEEFDRFFNVICGTGFFSYIAHTDDFCLVNVGEMNCYIFSPVCTDNQGLGAGILKVRRRKNVRRSVLNNNRIRGSN